MICKFLTLTHPSPLLLLSLFPEFGVTTADFTVEIRIFDLAGLLQPDALPAANLPKEENARRRFSLHMPRQKSGYSLR